MDQWIAWLIPLVALIIWIVANLYRVPSQQEQRPVQRRNPPPPSRPAGTNRPSAGQQPITDLDKFLQEVQRRRESQEKKERPRPAPPPPRTQPTSAREDIPVVQPVSPARQRTTPPPLPQTPPPRPSRPVTLKPASSAAASSRPPAQEIAAHVSMGANVVAALPASSHLTTPIARIQVQHRETSALAQEIQELLRRRRSAQVAFALREILDKPVSKRPKRRWY